VNIAVAHNCGSHSTPCQYPTLVLANLLPFRLPPLQPRTQPTFTCTHLTPARTHLRTIPAVLANPAQPSAITHRRVATCVARSPAGLPAVAAQPGWVAQLDYALHASQHLPRGKDSSSLYPAQKQQRLTTQAALPTLAMYYPPGSQDVLLLRVRASIGQDQHTARHKLPGAVSQESQLPSVRSVARRGALLGREQRAGPGACQGASPTWLLAPTSVRADVQPQAMLALARVYGTCVPVPPGPL
jgi:hypothetical protein